jgi:hypothetical protein
MATKINLIIVLVLFEVGLLGISVFKTFVADSWSYVIVSPKDENLSAALEVLGNAGYEVVSARRASDGAVPTARMSYEMILKRKGRADNSAVLAAIEIGQNGKPPALPNLK